MKRPSKTDELREEITRLRDEVATLRQFVERQAICSEDRERDLVMLHLKNQIDICTDITIATEHPVALSSHDHRFPRGTQNDNTRHPQFVYACERVLGRKIKHLDLGCAGGGLVWDFLINGHFSVGIEGSDYSRVRGRAEWATIPSHLFTADITKPFQLARSGTPLKFDVISAWELFEHIPESVLDGLLDNIVLHLADGGLLTCSVATFEDRDPQSGAVWHATVKPSEWWIDRFHTRGLHPCESPFQLGDYARGSGNPRSNDWDAGTNPELGFHLVARK